ncbi:MAG: xanthine dehydrogenase family protein subunit M [Thermoplasma acidophilum]|nr:xanthine dehydrogenase family protein subunit M [Thermoplasma acidophilum]
MYPQEFQYFSPSSVEDAISILEEYGEDAKILAGGQSLIPLLKSRIASYGAIVDISNIDALKSITMDDRYLAIGSMVRLSEIENSDMICRRFPIMCDASRQIADPLIRNMGTIGGNLSHGDPSNDMPAVMIALRSVLVAIGANGERMFDADGYVTGPYTNTLRPGEILEKILVPIPHKKSTGTYVKRKKYAGDFSLAGVAIQVEYEDGIVMRSGVALTSASDHPVRVPQAEEMMQDREITEELIRRASAAVQDTAEPPSDFYGTAEFKKKIFKDATEEALRRVKMNMR